MIRSPYQDASASVAALLLLLILAGFTTEVVLLLEGIHGYEGKSVERSAARQALERRARETLAQMALDPTPLADCPLDPAWESARGNRADGVRVEIADLSSAVNPNWVQKNLLEKTGLKNLLQPGKSPADLQQRREDRGFATDPMAAYGDLFQDGVPRRLLSCYGYANVNVTDEFALRRLYLLRTGDARGAEEFHAKVQDLLMARKVLAADGLRDFLGERYAQLYPLMNVEPLLNVHFLDPFVLTELLSYPDWGIARPDEVSRVLLERRDRMELTPEDLRRIIGPEGNNRVYQYLGVTTWFWKVSVTRGADRLDVVAARLPSGSGEPPRFLIVEERTAR